MVRSPQSGSSGPGSLNLEQAAVSSVRLPLPLSQLLKPVYSIYMEEIYKTYLVKVVHIVCIWL